MKKFYKIIISFILFFSTVSLNFAQDNTLYWMKHLPQSMNTNPAKQANCKLFIDIPVLPNFSLNTVHSGFTINDAVKIHPSAPDSFMIDLDGIEKALTNKNNIGLETDFSILNLGLALQNNMFVTFGINYKISESFEYPKALIELRRGNYRADRTPLSFDFGQNFMAHREIFVGLSKSFFGNLNIGGRIKVLSGYANFKTKQMKIDWFTSTLDEDMYDWTFDSDFEIRTSSPVAWNFEYDSITNQISGVNVEPYDITNNISGLIFPGNGGLAFDLGIEYTLNERFLFSASVVDLGFIKWKKNPAILTQRAQFVFSGLDIGKYIGSLNDVQSGTAGLDSAIMADMVDTLMTVFNPTVEQLAYTTGLNTKIYIGANVIATDWLDFGLLYKGAILNSKLYSSYTLSANANFFRGWSYTFSYSLMDGLANNIGMGAAYKLGPFQMYLLTDNFSAPFWVMNESKMSDNWIKNTKRINISFGVNFLLCGNKYDIGLLE
ncbi:MAG: DUF5723 family protein [Bacteroidales bacterium]|nr:DUF5723 family protein [Bacteroidales bacterium]